MKENNELIARFLGYEQNPEHPKYPNNTYWFKDGEQPLTVLLYDVSWDWLKIVIDKIYDMLEFKFIDDCTEEEWNVYTWFCNSKMNLSISIMYGKVVYFIQWYNEHENKN